MSQIQLNDSDNVSMFPQLGLFSVWFGVLIVFLAALGEMSSGHYQAAWTTPIIDVLQIVLAALILASLFLLFNREEAGLKVTAVPLLINLGTLLMLTLVPFPAIGEEIRFLWRGQGYDDVVQQVELGAWQPGADGSFQLPATHDQLSPVEGRVWVQRQDSALTVLFVTRRFGPERFAGYLYRSDEQPPSPLFQHRWRQLQEKRPHWFYVVSE